MKVYNNQFLLATVAELSMELYKDIVEEAATIISEKGLEKDSWMYSDPPHVALEYAVAVVKQQLDYIESWVPSEENPNILVLPKQPNMTKRII